MGLSNARKMGDFEPPDGIDLVAIITNRPGGLVRDRPSRREI